MNNYCTSRIYATVHHGLVEVTYIATHTNHELGISESKHLPLPTSVKETMSLKLQEGIPIERILDGMLRNTLFNLTQMPSNNSCKQTVSFRGRIRPVS